MLSVLFSGTQSKLPEPVICVCHEDPTRVLFPCLSRDSMRCLFSLNTPLFILFLNWWTVGLFLTLDSNCITVNMIFHTILKGYIPFIVIIKYTCIPLFLAALFAVSSYGKKNKVSVSRWTDKDVIHTHTHTHAHTRTHTHTHIRILLSHKKRTEVLPLETTWMYFEGIMLGEISQTEEHKYCIISLICVT